MAYRCRRYIRPRGDMYISKGNPKARTLLFSNIDCDDAVKRYDFDNGDGQDDVHAQKARLRLLAQRTRQARRVAPALGPRTNWLFGEACSRVMNTVFVIDTNQYMKPYIEQLQQQIFNIASDLHGATLHKKGITRYSVVGYKDHGDFGHLRTLRPIFDLKQVHGFLSFLEASGGGIDQPQDVLGALDRAASLDIRPELQNCLIHITNTPPHGEMLQNYPWEDDRWPVPGSEPHHLTHKEVLDKLISKNINYTLLRINNDTDRMAHVFCQAYATISASSSTLSSNMFANSGGQQRVNTNMTKNITMVAQLKASGKTESTQPIPAYARFTELQLGTHGCLRPLCVKAVIGTMTNPSTYRVQGKSRPSMPPAETNLEMTVPDWLAPGWLDEKLDCASYSVAVPTPYDDDYDNGGGSFLDRMMDRIDMPQITTRKIKLSKRSLPFSQGTTRFAYYARSPTATNDEDENDNTNRHVVKACFERRLTLPHVFEDMLVQALCKAFVAEFSSMVPDKYRLDFAVPTCLERTPSKAAGTPYTSKTSGIARCMLLEPWFDGPYVKYNSNGGWLNEELVSTNICQAAQAFSHYTFERSRGKFMVTNLRGVGRILSDAALQTVDDHYMRLSRTNLGWSGYCFFFFSHVCNSVCRILGLQSDRDMLYSREYKFRKVWPSKSHEIATAGDAMEVDGDLPTQTTNDWPAPLKTYVARRCNTSIPAFSGRGITALSRPQFDITPRPCPPSCK